MRWTWLAPVGDAAVWICDAFRPRRSTLTRNFGFHQLSQQDERLLPAEIAGFGRNGGGNPFLHYAHLGAAEDFFQADGRLHFAGQVGVVEDVGVAYPFVRHQFQELAAEGLAMAAAEV